MPCPYPPEFFSERLLFLMGRQVEQTANGLGIHEVTLHSWLRQNDINQERRPGPTSRESAEFFAVRQRIRQLEQELSILKRAQVWLNDEERVDPEGRTGESMLTTGELLSLSTS